MNKRETKAPTYRHDITVAWDHAEEIALIELSRMIREVEQKGNQNV